jgi:hypothetical protein
MAVFCSGMRRMTHGHHMSDCVACDGSISLTDCVMHLQRPFTSMPVSFSALVCVSPT